MRTLRAHELLSKLQEILVADSDLAAWCNEKYARPPHVYVGANNEQPPDPETTYPIIVIFSATRQKSANVDRVIYTVEIGVGIDDSDITDAGNGNIIYEGIGRVCEFRELAERAIENSRIAKIDVNSDTWEDMLFPLFASNSIIEFEFVKNYASFRRDNRR